MSGLLQLPTALVPPCWLLRVSSVVLTRSSSDNFVRVLATEVGIQVLGKVGMLNSVEVLGKVGCWVELGFWAKLGCWVVLEYWV